MTVTPMPSVTIWREPLSVAVSVDIGEMARSVNVSAAKSIIKYMELNPPPKKKPQKLKNTYIIIYDVIIRILVLKRLDYKYE